MSFLIILLSAVDVRRCAHTEQLRERRRTTVQETVRTEAGLDLALPAKQPENRSQQRME
jgi:hypothetical protein